MRQVSWTCGSAGPNPLHPDLMTADERIGQTANILAHGLVRFMAGKRSCEQSPDGAETSLHFAREQSVCRSRRTGEFR